MKYLIIILATLLYSCKPTTHEANETSDVEDKAYYIYTIDGCEYIKFNNSGARGANADWGSHKGDCKNPIHNHNKKDTVIVYIKDTVYVLKQDIK